VTTWVPCSNVRFLEGLVPNMELFAAAEQLIREHRDRPEALVQQLITAAVLLHAAIAVWVPGAESSSSSDGAGSSGGGGGDNAGSSSTTSSATVACAPGTLEALSSLAVSVTSSVRALELECKNGKGDADWFSLQACSFMAADLLNLAAHQLQQPQADRLAAMQLAGAGQRLAAACAEGLHYQTDCLQFRAMMGGAPGANGSSAPVELLTQIAATSLAIMQQSLQGLAAVLGGSGGHRSTTSGARVSSVARRAASIAHISQVLNGSRLRVDEGMPQLLGTAEDAQHVCGTGLQLVGCSHRGCTNLAGPSAEGLVAGRRGVRCGGCRVARYCCPACQQADWAQHRRVCRRLAAAVVHGGG
jgi:hypothetical protein